MMFCCGVLQAKHRKIRRWDVLWYVHSMALKWRALARRKEIREKAYQDALERAPDENAQGTIGALLETLQKADSPEVRTPVLSCVRPFICLFVAIEFMHASCPSLDGLPPVRQFQ